MREGEVSVQNDEEDGGDGVDPVGEDEPGDDELEDLG